MIRLAGEITTPPLRLNDPAFRLFMRDADKMYEYSCIQPSLRVFHGDE